MAPEIERRFTDVFGVSFARGIGLRLADTAPMFMCSVLRGSQTEARQLAGLYSGVGGNGGVSAWAITFGTGGHAGIILILYTSGGSELLSFC